MIQVGFTIYGQKEASEKEQRTGVIYTITNAAGAIRERKFAPDSRVVDLHDGELLHVGAAPWPVGYTRDRGVIDA